MILLECESAIIRNLLERSLDPNETLSETYKCCDFDGVSFYFKIDRPKKAEKDKIYPVRVEMNLPCWEEIKEYGAEDRYKELYGDWIQEPSEGYTHALLIPLTDLDDNARKEAITKVAMLKANILGAPFLWVAQKYAAKENFSPFEIPYRKATGESMYVCPAEKGAIVIFTIRFNDPGDRTLGNVFITELQAARTKVPSAPVVKPSPTAPTELEAFDLPAEVKEGKLYAFVSISLLDPQLSERKRLDTSLYIPMFRDYIHYHIKCTKAFLHQKMRIRAASLLRILEDAKPEPKVKVYRTVTGKKIGAK